MREATRIEQLTALAGLQSALTAQAASELAEARQAEHSARTATEIEQRSVQAAVDNWFAHHVGPVAPERMVALAAALSECERAADASMRRVGQAVERSGARERDWRSADAAEQATGRIVTRLQYRQRHRADERAADALAELATARWCRP